MRQMIDSTQIDQWFTSARRDAQEMLPHLIRRLVLETVDHAKLGLIRIPVGDEIGQSGYDGQVLTNETHPFVPQGLSVWECGAGAPAKKLPKEFQGRTANPLCANPKETTIVLVTPHPWAGKEAALAKWRTMNAWKGVRVLDHIDLATWLETAPGAARWLARQMGIPVEGWWDAEAYKKEAIDARYGVEMPPALLIGGRDDSVEQLKSWLTSDGRELKVEGESSEEAAGFIAGALLSLPGELAQATLPRTAFVDRPQVLDHLSSASLQHFVIALSPEARQRARSLPGDTLRLVLPIAKADAGGTGKGTCLTLPTVRRSACESALKEMGLSARQAQSVAMESKGSLTAVLLMIAREYDKPIPWLVGPAAIDLVPLVLAGQWSTANEADRQIVSTLCGCPYDTIERLVATWLAPAGPLILRGNVQDWIAWQFAWGGLARFFTNDHIERFCAVAREVLGTVDPKLALPPEDRWAAPIHKKTHPYSEAIRKGLIGSMVQFAVHGRKIPGRNGEGVANELVRHLLSGGAIPRASAWPSLSPYLPDLAEASPDVFLGVVEHFTDDEQATAAEFEEGGFFGSSPHVHLLWALERLAWCEDILTRVTLVLGRLAAVDPGGHLSNRPSDSLTRVYLPWYPNTTATVRHRLDAINTLYEQHPDVAWQLAVSLLPQPFGSTHATAAPQWRDWKPDDHGRSSRQEYWEFVTALMTRVLDWVGSRADRWEPLIREYNILRRQSPEIAGRVLATMQRLDPAAMTEAERLALSDSLRTMLAHHRELADADWAMNDDDLRPFEELYERFQPADPIARHLWLFTAWPELQRNRDISYEEQMRLVDEQRVSSLNEVYSQKGTEGVFLLAERAESPETVGDACARIDLDPSVQDNVLTASLGVEPLRGRIPAALRFGIGYIGQAYRLWGEPWLDEILTRNATALGQAGLANLAWGLPATSSIWDRIDTWGQDASRLYWERTPVTRVEDPDSDLERAVRSLLGADRPYRALDLAGMWVRRRRRAHKSGKDAPNLSSEVITRVLETAPQHDPQAEWFPPAIGQIGHVVGELIDILEDGGVGLPVLARLEWSWMTALSHTRRGLKALQRALSEDPALFIGALKLIFRGDNEEEADVSEAAQARATQAFRMLEEWHLMPGAVTVQVQEVPGEEISFAQGEVNAQALFEWVREARRLAAESGRLEICDSRIGNVLAYAPADPDGTWPCEPVRELIRDVKSEELENGLVIGVFNKRGAHVRAPGGEQERQLAAQFRGYAQKVRSKWPRTFNVLKRIADDYEREGKWHDDREAFEEFE